VQRGYLDLRVITGLEIRADEISKTTNLASINTTQLRSCPLALPPSAEQFRIVAKVDELMVLCDRLEAGLSNTDTTRGRLLDSLLADALAPVAGELHVSY
jgi:type I restriction enzyme S subunit